MSSITIFHYHLLLNFLHIITYAISLNPTRLRSKLLVKKKVNSNNTIQVLVISLIFLYTFALSADIISNTGNILFQTTLDGPPAMIVSSQGVAVGSSLPSANLDITGSALISGNLSIGGSVPGEATLYLSGTLSYSIETISQDTTLSTNTKVFIDTSTGNITLTLPSASSVSGRAYSLKRIHDDQHYVRISSGANIDGYTDNYYFDGKACLELISDGSKWVISSQYAKASPLIASDILIGYWKFDGSSGNTAYDSSSQGNHGSLISTFSYEDHGLLSESGKHLTFNGSQYVNAPASDTPFLGDISITVWAQLTSGSHSHHFIGKHTNNGASNSPFGFNTSNAATPLLEFSRANTGYRWYRGNSSTTILNTWALYSVTQTDSIETAPLFYVNTTQDTGTLAGGSGTGAPTGISADIRMGVRPDNSPTMIGAMKEVRVYNKVLSPTEIQAIYELGP